MKSTWRLLAGLFILPLLGCDSAKMDQAFKAHFNGKEGLQVLSRPEQMPPDILASLPDEFQLANQAGVLTLVLDGAGLIDRPQIKIFDFAVYAHNRSFIQKIGELKEQGLTGVAPEGYPHVYALHPEGPISNWFGPGLSQRWSQDAQTYRSLWSEATWLLTQVPKWSASNRSATLAYLDQRLAGAGVRHRKGAAPDPLMPWYQGFEVIDGKPVQKKTKEALIAAVDILTHPEKHFERTRARDIRKLAIRQLPLREGAFSLYQQVLEFPDEAMDLPAGMGVAVQLDFEGQPYDVRALQPTSTQLSTYKVVVEALAKAGLVRAENFDQVAGRGRFALSAYAPSVDGEPNLAYLAEPVVAEELRALVELNGLLKEQISSLQQSLAFLGSQERLAITARFGQDAELLGKLNQLEASP
ncbi:MAG: hypothetical protein RRB13_00095 [bacterium]|nr:hypothetical protein [bacterium]